MSSTTELATNAQERQELRDLMRAFLREHASESAVRDLMESADGYDRDVWRRCCDELELTSLIVPTAHGGVGYGWCELGVVMQEMGARVFPGPFLSTVFATTALLRLCSEPARAELLPVIANGTSLATFAAAGTDRPGMTRNALQCSNSRDGGRLMVTGRLGFVLDAHIADRLVVLTPLQDREAVLLIDTNDPAVRVTPLLGMDQTRRTSQVDLAGAVAREITSPDLTSDAVGRFFAMVTAALAAEQVGGADEAFQITLEYLQTRVQFGRPIGSFQAIKHRCADLALALENARVTCESALEAADRESGDLVLQAHVAAALCSETYVVVAREMMQLHGGVGFTWEHSAHLYLKRAKTSQMMLGIPEFHRRMVGRELGLVPGR